MEETPKPQKYRIISRGCYYSKYPRIVVKNKSMEELIDMIDDLRRNVWWLVYKRIATLKYVLEKYKMEARTLRKRVKHNAKKIEELQGDLKKIRKAFKQDRLTKDQKKALMFVSIVKNDVNRKLVVFEVLLFKLLEVISKNPLPVGELTVLADVINRDFLDTGDYERFGLNRNELRNILNRLEERGFVAKTQQPVAKNKIAYYATQDGINYLKNIVNKVSYSEVNRKKMVEYFTGKDR